MSKHSGISTISILGCGWLGAPLARNLLAEGYKVKGSTKLAEKRTVMKDVGIKPYLLTLTPELSQLDPDDFFLTDLLIIALPALTPAKEQDFHPRQIRSIAAEIQKHSIKKCIYLSSIALYPSLEKEITEEDAMEVKNCAEPAIREAELILQNISSLDLTILRIGDVYGYNRIPGDFTAERKATEEINRPVNYIHRDDVIGVVLEILKQDYWNQILNVVAPLHPNKQDVYNYNAKAFGFEATSVLLNKRKAGFISSKKLQSELQYQFLHPNPLLFRYT